MDWLIGRDPTRSVLSLPGVTDESLMVRLSLNRPSSMDDALHDIVVPTVLCWTFPAESLVGTPEARFRVVVLPSFALTHKVNGKLEVFFSPSYRLSVTCTFNEIAGFSIFGGVCDDWVGV